jgi:hypothetical protein
MRAIAWAGIFALLAPASVIGLQGLRPPAEVFDGQRVTVTPGTVGRGIAATLTAARVCLSPSGQCFSPSTSSKPPFGAAPTASVVRISANKDALLFTAIASGGGSGSAKMIALLGLEAGRLADLLPDVSVSEQGQFVVWQEPTVSAYALIVTADYVWGGGEAHFTPHRYRISTYAMGAMAGGGEPVRYFLQDEYLTSSKHAPPDRPDGTTILDGERAEAATEMTFSR